MRALLIALVLANLLALAWWQGWLADWSSPAGTADGRAAEIAPERLKVVPLERLEAGASSGGLQPAPIPAAGESTRAAPEGAASSVDGRGQAQGGSATGSAPPLPDLPAASSSR